MPDETRCDAPKESFSESAATSAPPMRHTIFDTPILRSVLRFASLILLKATGWKLDGHAPQAEKFVLVSAPHTSNYDFLFFVAIIYRFRLKLYWMGKDALFNHPLKCIVRYTGGIPVDRSKKSGVVDQTIELFRQSDRLAIAIPVEGTREKTEGWKSGFYHIARGANVPIVLGFLDYEKKIGGFGPEMLLTGDIQADMAVIADFYADIAAKHPEKKSEPRLSS